MKLLYDYAISLLGTPYVWGGEDPTGGMDCSGFVQELLRSVGIDPKGDQTSGGLYRHFLTKGDLIGEPIMGSLLFYGKNEYSITHIAMGIGSNRIIEAAGGGSRTTSVAKAAEHDAFIRIRPYNYRSDLQDILFPEYPDWMERG